MRVGELCCREVVFIGKDDSVFEAAGLMRSYQVGDVVVVEQQDGRNIPVGILTDRDIVIELVADRVDYNDVAIKDVMSFQLVTATEDEDVMDALERMKTKGVRRLPVVDGAGALVGILAVDDLIEQITEQLSDLVSLISKARRSEQRKHSMIA